MPALPFLQRGDWLRSICPYCGTGCGVLARAKGGVVSEVRGDPDHPVNRGQLCAKGALLAQVIPTDDRLRYPMRRDYRGAVPHRVQWDKAITFVADSIRDAVATHGPDSVMVYGSGQLLTEDYYLLGKLTKGFIGTNNQDTNSRLCMSSAVAAYQLALGSDAQPASYADIDAARTFLIVGANVEACHPILFNRIKARKRADRDVRVIVVDPRRTRTAEIADLHLAVRPGTDLALLNSLLYEVALLGGLDESFIAEHTTGWEALRDSLAPFQAELAAGVTGVPAAAILEAAKLIAANGPFLSMWTMGANQSTSGVDKNLALINLSLATGQIGKPGVGPFSLTGQPNAMGGREAGGLAASLPGHRQVANAGDRAVVERAWGVPAGAISPRAGLTAIEMLDGLERGDVKVVWIVGSNPLASLPNLERVRRAFARAELVIVQDPYHATETTRVADVILAAAQWSERAGTMTNCERRICLLERVGDPPGEALADWEIIARVGQALGFVDAFTYDGPEAIFDEYRALTCGRDCDITGLSYEALRDRPEGVQWPFPAGATAGTERLFTDHYFATDDGRARFHVPEQRPAGDEVTAAFPLVLLTGRVKDQWHTMTRTGKVEKLNRSEYRPFLEIHPDDARVVGVSDGEQVRVTSRRGSAQLVARVTPSIRAGAVFAPFH